MNEIFTVYVVANYYCDDEGNKVLYSPEERNWVDSYWADEAAALTEAKRLWDNDKNEFLDEIIVFGRTLNVRGSGRNEWINERDRLIKRYSPVI